jgi:hypothetical protein
VIASVGLLGASSVLEARQIGFDRYAEAELVEQLHAEEYATQIGGSVVKDSSSVFTPDGGIDRIVMAEAGEKTIQSKHFGNPVGGSILEQYSSDVDVFAATNGLKESTDPSTYEMETLTSNDWSLWSKLKLEAFRVKRGYVLRFDRSKAMLRRGAGRGLTLVKSVVSRLFSGIKSAIRLSSRAAKLVASRFRRLPIGKQIVVVLAAIGAFYLLWRWYKNDDTETSDS